jgi:hypothetical protein
MATKFGKWEGSSGFTYANGSYVMSMTSYPTSKKDFQDNMDLIYQDMVLVGQYMRTQDLAVNLLFWMSWVEVATANAAQRFSLTGR